MVKITLSLSGTALFLLCATAVAHADLDDSEINGFFDNGCPKDTSIDKLLPHEKCDQYYQCFHGGMISRVCPNGLNFNADLEKCDWLDKSDCHKKRKADIRIHLDKNNPRHAALICSNTESNGVLIAHKNCHQFYKCSNSRSLVLNCAQDLLYNTELQKCDWPKNVICGERIKIVNDTIITTTQKDLGYSYTIEEFDQSNADPSPAAAQCSARRSDGLLIPHEYCNKFYKCSGGEPIIIKCPNNLLYNPNIEFCDWPGNVDCDGRVTVYVDDNYSIRSGEKNIDNEENENSTDNEEHAIAVCAAENSDGVLAVHDICNHFYKCSDNKPMVFKCPGDLLFNSKKYYCDWANNVICDDRIKPEDVDENDEKFEDTRQADTMCSAEGSDGMLVAHNHCNQFYKCHDGLAVVVKCPGILLYNIGTENCDWPTHVYCKDRIVPENAYSPIEDIENNMDRETGNNNENNLDSRINKYGNKTDEKNKNKNGHANLSNAVYTCEDEANNGKLLPHEFCNQFYKCIELKAVSFFCPINLYYNIQKQYCDWLHNVKCGDRLLPMNDSSSEGDSNNANMLCQGKTDGSIIPHGNCSQFYKCVNSKSYIMDCPPGLYYSASLKVCDWPTNVDCGNRLKEVQLKKKKT